MTTIKSTSEIDQIQKAIYRLISTAEYAFTAAPTLDEKVEMERLRKELLAIDRQFKLQRFSLEDAIKLATGATRCPECRHVVQTSDLD